MTQPNIIFFMVDQLAAKWLEAAMDGICDLLNIQRLKSQGASFTNAITSNPVCCAARSTLATGLTARGHGVIENGYQLAPALPTFLRMLQVGGLAPLVKFISNRTPPVFGPITVLTALM